MDLDYADDWEIIDDTQAVSFLSKTGQGVYAAAVAVPAALRRAVTASDIQLGIVKATERSTAWHVWAAHLPGVVPKAGDVVADGSERWTVRHCEQMDEGTRHRLACVLELGARA